MLLRIRVIQAARQVSSSELQVPAVRDVTAFSFRKPEISTQLFQPKGIRKDAFFRGTEDEAPGVTVDWSRYDAHPGREQEAPAAREWPDSRWSDGHPPARAPSCHAVARLSSKTLERCSLDSAGGSMSQILIGS